MTREKAIKRLELHKRTLLLGGGGDLCDALDVAIATLREQESAENAHCSSCKKCNSWISVNEQLPEHLPENKGKKIIPCIVALESCYPNGKATIQKRQRQPLYNYDGDQYGWEWSRIGASRVTHWQPLPEPPEGV